MPIKLTRGRSPLFFLELDYDTEVVVESPRDELERRVMDKFDRRVASQESWGALKAVAQAVLDDMLQRGETCPVYSKGHVRVGWWVNHPYIGRHWVDAADVDRDIEIPGLFGVPMHFSTRGLIDRTTLQIEVHLDEGVVDWFQTPREVTIRKPRG